MAEETSVLKSFLTCQVCFETFEDPVSLGCHHNFCSSCLQKFWDQAKNKNCPTCRRKSSKDNVVVNFGIQELVHAYAGRQRADPAVSGAVGRIHEPDLPKYNIAKLKRQLESDLGSLEEKICKYKEIDKTYDDMNQRCKKQLMNTKSQIRAEFDQLHQFLKREEEGRLAALQEEEEQKIKTITLERKEIHAHISVVSEVISAVKRDLAQEDNAAFLASYELTQTSVGHLCSRPDPQLLPGGLVDVAKHLGNLSFRVWEKMREECIKFTPVILDPNTAAKSLYPSDDLTSVRKKRPAQDHPDIDNPERFMVFAEILGSEGFISGKYCWEVEVGDHPDWLIGVSKESVDRKGKRSAAPKDGLWCLVYKSEKYTNGSGKLLTLKKIPQRIRVVLDCDRGEVSFYNPEGNDHIYTHEATFSEKIYPYFGLGKAGEAQTIDIKVCDECQIGIKYRSKREKMEKV